MAPDDPRGTWLSIGISCALAACAIDFGTLHRLHDADSLLLALVSTQRWTPFYWGQDRLGMLLPLLARPLRDPFANLLAQSWASAFAALLTFFLLPRYARVPHFALCGLVGVTTFLLCCPAALCFQFLQGHQPYGLSLALGTGGLVLWNADGGARRAAGFLLVLCAHWVNSTIWLALAPLALLTGLVAPRARALGDCVVVLVGAAFGLTLKALSHAPPTPSTVLTPHLWPEAWWLLAANVWRAAGAWLLSCAMLGIVGSIALLRSRRRDAMAARSAVVLIASGLVYGFVVGATAWVKTNQSLERYALPTIVSLATALIALGLAPAGNWAARHRRATNLALPAMLLTVAAAAYGFPALAAVRADIDRVGNSGWTERVLAEGCTHVAGRYWRVWPSVFYANLLLRERGESRTVWGVAERGADARKRWRNMPRNRIRVCLAPGDVDAPIWMRRLGLGKLVTVSEDAELAVLSAPGRRSDPTPP